MSELWRISHPASLREHTEVIGVVALVTLVGWYSPLNYHAIGHLYLLTVIALSLRVGRVPVLAAAVVSAVTWDYVFIPPKLSFSILDLDESLTLGAYFFAALIGGQLTAQIRSQERRERQREQRSSALFDLTRALAAAPTFDAAVVSALRQADNLFEARSALLLTSDEGPLASHPASSLPIDEKEWAIAAWTLEHGKSAGQLTENLPASPHFFLPLQRPGRTLGVMVLGLTLDGVELTPALRDLMEAFATQIALLVERERLRAASEREERLAESDRLHRTLLDSVSHELKTPLAVLRSATEKLDTNDENKRAVLTAEIRTATRRLDHLVANLLDQTRLESGRLNPQMDWCDVRDLFSAARRAVGDGVGDRRLLTEIPEDFPLIMADAVLMEQVLANLLLNALLHTPAEALIRLSAGVNEKEQKIVIMVEDGGPGFSDEIHAQLFQKFYRGRNASRGGLGLGLSIVKGFTLAQGGEVVASVSALGGACFTVILPHWVHEGVPSDEH